jgi:glutamate racemase
MVKDAERPIGVFDSGVGGLTVAAAIQRALPGESIVYFGDLLHLPYGSKSSRAVEEFTRAAVQFLLERSVKLIVIACNTATSIAAHLIREEVNVPVLGVIDTGARAACRMTVNRRIGVIGTKRTIESNAYVEAIGKFDPRAEVFQRATPLLVPLIEEGWQSHPATRLVLREYLRDFTERGIDTIVLGCTHYPLIRSEIKAILGDVHVVDSADTTAGETAEILGHAGRTVGSRSADEGVEKTRNGRVDGGFRVYLTDYTDVFGSMGEQILGVQLNDLHVIDLHWEEGAIHYAAVSEVNRQHGDANPGRQDTRRGRDQ